MNDATATTEATEVKKVAIRPDISKMVKTKSGSYHKDDFIGHALDGLTLAQVKEIAEHVGLDPAKYVHLNNGQQRMTLGSQLRKVTATGADEAKETAAATLRGDIESMAKEFRFVNEDNIQAAAEQKAIDKAKAAKAKEDKEASKKAA